MDYTSYMKIVFIGGVKFSHAILETILKGGFSVDAVFSYDDSNEKIYSDYKNLEEKLKLDQDLIQCITSNQKGKSLFEFG